MTFYNQNPAYGLIPSSYSGQARYFCLLCRAPLVPLPTLEDFKTIPHSASSRIKLITNERGWRFENFRGQVYFRSLGKVPAWSFCHPGGFTRLCVHQEAEIEVVYGQFVNPNLAADKDWIFKGYIWTGPQNASTIWFSEKDYADCAFNQERTRTGEFAFSPRQLEVPRPRSPVPVHSASQVFSELQKAFVEKYKEMGNWRLRFPLKINFARCEVNHIFDLTERQETCFDANDTSHVSIFQPYDAKNKRILIQAAPGYGKTTLTAILAHQWAHNSSETNNYKLCILCDLLRLTFETNVTSQIVNNCVKMLNKTFTSDMVETALTKNSEKIVLLFDSYDLLPEDSQQKVLLFLESSSVFKNSTFLVTTRLTNDDAILKLFQKHIYIRGFSKTYFNKYLFLNYREHESVTYLCEKIGEVNMRHLSVLSPYFTLFVFKVVSENVYKNRYFQSVYIILRHTVQMAISVHITSSSSTANASDQLFYKLGEILFCALVKNKIFFGVEVLKRAFGDKFGILVQCNIFHRKDRHGKLWFVLSKVLNVFFATMYLRDKWSKLRNDEQRRRFLRDVFCCGACLGDYIQGEDYSYYVGVIPEVVLKFTSDRLLESATFEMYHDVERVEFSAAFDSVNLLSRVTGNYLNRFNFKVLPKEDRLLLRTFAGVFDFMSVDNCDVDYFFYTNEYEKKNFMIIDVYGDKNSIILKAILRSDPDKTIDSLYIDFMYHEIDNLFDLLSGLLSQFLKDFEFPRKIQNLPLVNFVFNLVWLISISNRHTSATVSCGKTETGCFRNCASFEVCSNEANNNTHILVLDQDFKGTKYDTTTFFKVKTQLKTLFENCDKSTADLQISVQLF